MPQAYFISPFTTIWPIGGGQWSASSVGAVRGPANGPRLLIYAPVGGLRSQFEVPFGAAGLGKPFCVCWVETDDTTLAAMDADAQIIRLPWGPAELDQTFADLPGAVQTGIVNRLETARIPADWIQPTTTLRQLLGFVLRVIVCARELGTQFPELDLSLTLASISAARRNAIRNWLAANGATSADLTNTSTIREVLGRLRQLAGKIRIQGQEF